MRWYSYGWLHSSLPDALRCSQSFLAAGVGSATPKPARLHRAATCRRCGDTQEPEPLQQPSQKPLLRPGQPPVSMEAALAEGERALEVEAPSGAGMHQGELEQPVEGMNSRPASDQVQSETAGGSPGPLAEEPAPASAEPARSLEDVQAAGNGEPIVLQAPSGCPGQGQEVQPSADAVAGGSAARPTEPTGSGEAATDGPGESALAQAGEGQEAEPATWAVAGVSAPQASGPSAAEAPQAPVQDQQPAASAEEAAGGQELAAAAEEAAGGPKLAAAAEEAAGGPKLAAAAEEPAEGQPAAAAEGGAKGPPTAATEDAAPMEPKAEEATEGQQPGAAAEEAAESQRPAAAAEEAPLMQHEGAKAAEDQPAAAAKAEAGVLEAEPGEAAESGHPAAEAPVLQGPAEAAAAEPPAAPAPIIPGVAEEQHPLKPQWRRGYSGASTEFLMVTVTQGDCNSRRMRPPRQWYDALLGGAFGTFEVVVEAEADVGDEAEPTKFYPQAHAYEYCKSEYYVQGSECKRLFKDLNLQPGDGLVFKRSGVLPSGVPCTKLSVLRAADNPYAAFVLNSAATAQSRRAATQGDPNRKKTPKKASAAAAGAGAGGVPANSRKRKMAPTRAATDGMPHSYNPPVDAAEAEGGRAKRSVRSRKFPYGDEFVTGQQQFWGRGAAAAAAAAGEEDAERGEDGTEGRDVHMSGSESDGEDAAISEDSHHAATAAPAAAAKQPPKSPLLAAAAAAQVREERHKQERRATPPRVMAMKIEGRNVLRIKLPSKRPAQQAAGAGFPAVAAATGTAPALPHAPPAGPFAGAPAASQARPAAWQAAPAARVEPLQRDSLGGVHGGSAQDEALDSLVALAAAAEDGMDTGRAGKSGGSEVNLLSKSLMRDVEGRVVGAQLKLGWEPQKTAFSSISRSISEYGMQHHDTATVEDFEVQPAEHQIRLTLRVAEAGRIDLLEKAVMDLVGML